ETLRAALRRPTAERAFQIKRAFLAGFSVEEVAELTQIDPWFLSQLAELVDAEAWYRSLPEVGAAELRRMKSLGFSDRQLAELRGETEAAVRERRWALGVRPSYHEVETFSGNPDAATSYLYSSYDEAEAEVPV